VLLKKKEEKTAKPGNKEKGNNEKANKTKHEK